MEKLNLSDESLVREKVAGGIKKMYDLVSLTLGPVGRSVMIERPGEPLIVDDGRRVAENIKFSDPVEQMAVRVCYWVTRKTDEKVGDGTTTSMCIVHGIVKDNIAVGPGIVFDVAQLDRNIQIAKDEVVAALKKMAKPVKTEAELIEVATVVTGDKALGEMIGKMQYELGENGHISIEFNFVGETIETQLSKGYSFEGGNATLLVSDSLRKTITEDDVHVLLINQKVTDFSTLVPMINTVAQKGKNRLLIIAQSFSESVIKGIHEMASREKSPFIVWAIRAPGQTKESFKDMEAVTGGKCFQKENTLDLFVPNDLGYISKFEFEDDVCFFVDGGGKPEVVAKRIKEVEEEVKQAKVDVIKKGIKARLSALSSGHGVIKIGAPTNEERNWLKYKIEDAREAVKHALRSGVVQGGGMALKKVSDSLPDGNVLKNGILMPYETLKRNSGGKFTVPSSVKDPVAVEIAAVENACSAASKLLRIGGAIAYKPESLTDQLQKVLKNNNVE